MFTTRCGRLPSTALREDRSAFHHLPEGGEWSAGHAPAGDESSTQSTRCSPTYVRTVGCTETRNEYSGKAAPPALRIAFAGFGFACPATQPYARSRHAPTGRRPRLCCLHWYRLG